MTFNLTKDGKPIEGRLITNEKIYQIIKGVSYGKRIDNNISDQRRKPEIGACEKKSELSKGIRGERTRQDILR